MSVHVCIHATTEGGWHLPFQAPLELFSLSSLHHSCCDHQMVPALILLLSFPFYPLFFFFARIRSCSSIHSHTTHHSEYFCSKPLPLGLFPEFFLSWLTLFILDFISSLSLSPIYCTLTWQVHTLISTHIHFHQHEHTQTDTCILIGIHRHTHAH